MLACDRYGYLPDIIICAKGISSGYAPVGAAIFSELQLSSIVPEALHVDVDAYVARRLERLETLREDALELGPFSNVHFRIFYLRGTLIASLALGVIESYGTIYLGAVMDRDAIAFAFLIVVLMIRPQGLFART